MLEFIAENATPNPKSTINSYRSFGYNLSTAIADIVDNCISAKGSIIKIDTIWNGSESYIKILDNGKGMDLPELINAMTPGSKDPDESRDINDLGRFGMGLKTASFSQCKRLTVITKKKNGKVLKRCWDIDFINQQQQWTLLDFVSNNEFIHLLEVQESGTMILWEKMDRIVGKTKKENEAAIKIQSAYWLWVERQEEALQRMEKEVYYWQHDCYYYYYYYYYYYRHYYD